MSSPKLEGAWLRPAHLPDVNDPARARCRAIRCLPGEIAPYALLPGDPARAERIAREHLDDAHLVMANREFHSYTGRYRGIAVSVVSTGLGSPGTAMVVDDLARLGVQVAIRVGTAGSGQPHVHPGDLVIATGAVRDDAVTHHHVPGIFPAVADADVLDALRRAAHEFTEVRTHRGVVHTCDAFQSPRVAEQIEVYTRAGVLAYEMEASAVLIFGSLRGIAAGCILGIDGRVANVQAGNVVPEFGARDRAIGYMIGIALRAIELLDQAKGSGGAPRR
jgi:uridine phosphorylase